MKKFLFAVAALLCIVGCEYDDTEIKNSIAQLEQRLSAVETVQNAYKNNLFIKSITHAVNRFFGENHKLAVHLYKTCNVFASVPHRFTFIRTEIKRVQKTAFIIHALVFTGTRHKNPRSRKCISAK